jgi:hypothetical protein
MARRKCPGWCADDHTGGERTHESSPSRALAVDSSCWIYYLRQKPRAAIEVVVGGTEDSDQIVITRKDLVPLLQVIGASLERVAISRRSR